MNKVVPDAGNTAGESLPNSCGIEPRFRVAPWHIASIFCALVLLANLNSYGLLDPDEGRYAEIPREMMESGNYVLPQLNYVPYLEKPPLMYWVTVASFRLFGMHEWAVRLVPAVFAILGMLVAWWLTLICFGRQSARWAPAILASSVVFFVVARIPIIDMMFSVLFAAALTAWLAGEHSTAVKRYGWWLVSGIILGATVLAKGPVASVLFAAVVFIYLLWVRRPALILPGVGLPLVLSTALFAPWCIAAQHADPQFNHYFFMVQHVNRFLGRGTPEHVRPFYFYVVLLPVGFGLWSLYWPAMVRAAKHAWPNLQPRLRQDSLFLAIWFAVVLLFFSVSSCKLVQYILPIWWPMVAITAAWLRREFCLQEPRRRLYVPTMVSALIVGVSALGAIIYSGHQHKFPPLLLQRPLLIFAGASVIAFGLLLFASFLRNRHWTVAQLAIGAILPLAALLPAVNVITQTKDMNGLIPPQLMNLPKPTPWTIAQWRVYNQSISFYTHQRVVMIDTANEIKLGLNEPDAAQWFLKGEDNIAKLSRRGPLALVVDCDAADQVARQYGLHSYKTNQDRAMLFNDAGLRLLNQPPPAQGLAPPGIARSIADVRN